MLYQKLKDIFNLDYSSIRSLIKEVFESEGGWNILLHFAEEHRSQLHFFSWLVESLLHDDELVSAAIPILHGLIHTHTICAHCEFDVTIPFMQKLAQIYQTLGDYDNTVKTYQQIIIEIKNARNIAQGIRGIEYLVKRHMIKPIEYRTWSIDWTDKQNVQFTFNLTNMLSTCTGDLDANTHIVLIQSGIITMLDWYLSKAYAEFANFISRTGDPTAIHKAQKMLLEAKHIDENYEDWAYLGATYNDLGNLSRKENTLFIAIEYYFKALEAHTKCSNKKGIANALTNIGLVYSTPGNMFNPYQALKFLIDSLPMHQEVGNKQSELNAIVGIYGIISIGRGNNLAHPVEMNEAFPYLSDKAIKLLREHTNIINYSLNTIRNLPNQYSIDDGYNSFRRLEWSNLASQISFDQLNFNGVLNEVNKYCKIISNIFSSLNIVPEKYFIESSGIIMRGIASALELYQQSKDQDLLILLVNLIEREKSRNLIKMLYANIDTDVIGKIKEIKGLENEIELVAKIVNDDPASFRERA